MADAAPRKIESLKRSLRLWNYIVALVHSTSFVSLLIISIVNAADVPLVRWWTDFNQTATSEVIVYGISATLLPFPAITALFHLLAAWDVDNYYSEVLCRGVNRLRWVEYAITNSLITVSLLTLVGASNLYLIVACVLSNVVMQYFGYAHEVQNHPANSKPTLTPLLVGFLPFFAIWIATLAYQISGTASPTTYGAVAVYGSLFFALMFVVPLLVRYSKTGSEKIEVRANYTEEMFYILLSLTAKLFLDWTVTIGYLTA